MAPPGGEKPYRLYRGGRVKGRVPTGGAQNPPPRKPRPSRDGKSRGPGARPAAAQGARKIRWGRELGIAIVLVVLFLVFWALLGYLTFRGGVSAANKRLPQSTRNALTPDRGSMLDNSTSILLLGTDHSLAVSRAGEQHSDSITLLRTDPAHHRLYYLSIPRDLRVQVPGYGDAKINTAFQVGGPRLAARTIAGYTDIPVNHLIVVNFAEFGWNSSRAGTSIHCRLGGISTGGDITPSEDNAKVILMVLGKSAVQPPAPSGDTYPPGCVFGNPAPGSY